MAKCLIQRWQLWYVLLVCVRDQVCMRSFFGLVLLMGCIDSKEKEPFAPNLHFYNKCCVLFRIRIRCSRKISGIDRCLSSCVYIKYKVAINQIFTAEKIFCLFQFFFISILKNGQVERTVLKKYSMSLSHGYIKGKFRSLIW